MIGTIKLLNVEVNSIKFGLRGTALLAAAFAPKLQVRTIVTKQNIEEQYEDNEEVEEEVHDEEVVHDEEEEVHAD